MSYKSYMEKFVAACLYLLLLTPLIFQQQLMHPLVTIKIVVFQILIEIAFVAYLALAIAYPEYRPRVTMFSAAIFALFAIIVAAGIFGVNSWRSVWSIPERMTGIFLLAHLAAFFVMLRGMSVYFSWIRYFSFSVAVSFLVALFPVVQLFAPGIFFDKMSERLGGVIGNPIFLSAYLMFHIFIGGWLAAHFYGNKNRWWWICGAIAFFDLVVIFLTQTRGALVALVVAAAAFSVVLWGRLPRIGRQSIAALWIAAVVFGGIFAATRHNSFWKSVPVMSRLATEGFQANARLMAWNAGIKAFADRPLLGWGWENFYTAFNNHYDPRLLRYGFNETFFDKPHNTFIQFLVETGIVGFFAYFVVFGLAFWYARRRPWLIALIAAYLTQMFFAFDTMESYLMIITVFAFIDTDQSNFGNIRTSDVLILAQGAPRFKIALAMGVAAAAVMLAPVYFVNYRVWQASHWEWKSVNYFVQHYIPEGLEYFNKALAATTPYHQYIQKDLAPNIAFLYKQGVALPDVKNLVARAVAEMQSAIEREPMNYSFFIGFADMMPDIGVLDPAYFDIGEAVLARAEEISPRRQATQYVLAKIKNLKGDRAGALAAMKQAIALDPEVGDAHFYYALLLLEDNNVKNGIEELRAASRLGREPKNEYEARVAAGHLGDAGFYKESQKYYQRALLFIPDDLETKMKLGLVYFFDKQYDAARREISGVIKTQNLSKSPQYEALLPILRELGLSL